MDDDARGQVEVFRRRDGKWAWHVKARNGRIVATDGGQGYENRIDAETMALAVTSGTFTKDSVPTLIDGVWTEQ